MAEIILIGFIVWLCFWGLACHALAFWYGIYLWLKDND